MNKVYKTVWNALRQCIVVVSEAMSSQARAGKKASKVGLVSTVAAAGMLVGAQAGAQTVQVEALVGLDNTDGQSQTVELPANPTELNALTAEQYNNLIFHTVVAQKGTMNETVTFGNEESTQAFFKDSDRVTQNLGLKALTDFSKVEVTDGHHLVLIGEDSGVQDAESFSILGDGDLYVHGNDGTTETRVSLGALGAKQSKGQLNDIYVGVSPTDIDGSTGTGILEIRNGQYTAKDVYNGAQIIIGEIEDKDSALTAEKLVVNSEGVIQNYGTLTATALASGQGTHGGQIINQKGTLVFNSGDISAFIDNYGTVNGGSLILRTGAEKDANGWGMGSVSQNERDAEMNLTSLTLEGLAEFEAGAWRAGGLSNDSKLNVTGDMTVKGYFKNNQLGQAIVGANLKVENDGQINNEGFLQATELTLTKGAITGQGATVFSTLNVAEGTRLEQATLEINPDAENVQAKNQGEVIVSYLRGIESENAPQLINSGTLQADYISDWQVNNTGKVEVANQADFTYLNNSGEGTVTGETGTTLKVDRLVLTGGTVSGDTIQVIGSSNLGGGKLKANHLDLTGAELNLSSGEIQAQTINSNGATVNVEDSNWTIADQKWFEDATINFKANYEIGSLGSNTVNVNQGAKVSVDTLTEDTQVTVNEGGTLAADTIQLGDEVSVTLNGGSLETAINEIFIVETTDGDQPVDAEGNPVGEPLFGGASITGIQADILTGLNKTINGSLNLSGNYTLGQTDSQVMDVLTANGFDTEKTQLVLSGTNIGQEANITSIKELVNSGKYDAGLILANTTFENRVATDQAYEQKAQFDSSYGGHSFGFKDIAGAAVAEVSDGNHLTLVGSSDVENYNDAHLLDSSKGSTSITLNGGNDAGYLTLGLASGTATKGWVDTITDNNDSGEVSFTVQNGEFGTGQWTAGKSEIKNSGVFTVTGNSQLNDVVTVTSGSLSLQGDLSMGQYGQIINNDMLTIASGEIGGQGLVNNVYTSIGSATVTGQLENSGMLDVKGTLTVTNGQVTIKDGLTSIENLKLEANGSEGFIQTAGETSITTLETAANSSWALKGGTLEVGTYTGEGNWSMTDGALSIGDYQATSPIEVQGGQLTIDKKGDQTIVVTGTDEKEAIMQLTAQDPMTGHVAVSGNSQMIFGDNTDIAGVPETGTRVVFSQKTTLADGATLNVGSTTKGVVDATFGKDSVTVVDAGALGLDNAAFVAGGSDQSLKVEEGAQLIIGNAKDQGNYVVTEGFNIDENFDSEGNWIGGWADGVKVLSQAGTGLGFDIEFNTNKDDGSIYITTVLNDVSVLYPNIGIQSIANAAVRAEGEMAAGLSFVKDVLSSESLTVDEKTNAVNSVAEIGLASGSMAVALNDVETVTDSIVNRLSLAEEPSKANGLWVDMLYSSQEADDMKADGHMKYGFETDSYGFIMGYDHQVANSNVRLGAAFSYQKGDLDSTGDVLKTTNDYNTFGFHGYGVWQPTDRINVLGSVSYLRSSSDVEQQLGVAAHNKATADIDTNVITAGARVEGVFPVAQGVTVVPHIGARVIHADSGSYDTKIDGAKAFDNDADAATLFQVPIGVAVRMDKTLDNGWTVRPHTDLTVIPQFGDTEQDIKVKTGAFTDTVSGDVAGDFATKASFGVQATKNNTTVGARYGFTAGDMGRQDHAFKVEVRYAF